MPTSGNTANPSLRSYAKRVSLLIVVALLICAPLSNVSGQLDTSGGGSVTAQEQAAEEKQPHLIDSQVESMLRTVSAYINKVRSENFPLYISIYSAIVSALLGLTISLLGYRFSDPRSAYTELRRRGSLLAMTCGGAVGVLLAVLKAPANLDGKLTVLLMSIVSGGIAGWILAFLTFLIQRHQTSILAKKEGRVLSQRIGRR